MSCYVLNIKKHALYNATTLFVIQGAGLLILLDRCAFEMKQK